MYIKVDNQQSVEDFKANTKKGVWVILYYASWCPHCQSMKPEWEKFASKYSSQNDINVADIESEFLDKAGPEHKQNVVGFPTIVSCKNGKKVLDFNGPRTSDEIDKFANSTSSPSLNSNLIANNVNNEIQKNNTQAVINSILKNVKSKKDKKTKKSKTKKVKKTKKTMKSKKSRK